MKTILRTFGVCALAAVAIALIGDLMQAHPLLLNSAQAGNLTIAMAVVAAYGTGSRDPSSLKAVDGIFACAETRMLNSQIAIGNGDSIASIYRFGEIPADCIIDPNSVFWYGAATGVTDFDIGLRYPNGGAVILADCIVNGQDIHLAGSATLAAATGSGVATAANQQKRAWQLAGLASNPGGNLEVYGTANAASTAAVVANLFLRYFKAV